MPAVFQVDGIEAFQKSIERFVKVVEQDTSQHIRNLAYRISFSLVMETPQYSGAAASAWRVGIGSPELVTDKPFYAVPTKGAQVLDIPFSKRNRNMKAVNDALALCGFEIGMYTLPAGDLYIMNGLDYTTWFEQGMHAPGKMLREVNRPQRQVAQVVRESLNAASILRF